MSVVGIDEVGRGCWAGPLVAAAVILNKPIPGLKDSKRLRKSQRTYLAKVIKQEAMAIGIGWVDAETIDRHGLTEAVRNAMQQALAYITIAYDEVIIDGHFNFLERNPKARAVIKADGSIAAVSAASIIAKVARDTYMEQAAALYPEYGFDSHVGYGTALHVERLKLHGITDLHRRSFKPVQALLK